MKTFVQCILTIAALAATPAISFAQVPPDQRIEFGDPKTAARSGPPGVATRLEAKSKYQYLIDLVAREHSDKPCQVTARFAHVNQLNEFEQTWTDPGCKKPTKRSEEDLYPKSNEEHKNGTFFITSLRTCISRINTRVKGVKGEGHDVTRATFLTQVEGTDSHIALTGFPDPVPGFDRFHCKKSQWQTPSQCGNNRVATGIVIEHEDGSWTSLRLICSLMFPKK